jgi:DNA polymerase
MPYLRRQISLIGPRIMVLLGMVPAKTVLGMYGIRFTSMGEMVGKVFHVDDVILVPCYHPAAALYNPRLVDRIRETLRKVGELYQK